MLETLTLTHFRNLSQVRVAVPGGARVVGLVGPNGVGKTSILEAISLLSPTRGLLGAEARQQVQHGQREAGIHATLATGDVIGQLIKKGERVVQVNGQKEPTEALSRLLSLVWLTPQTDFLFSGPPDTRRRWLDDATTALLPAHAAAVTRFRQHRQGRLKVLTNPSGTWHGDWLDAEEKLAAEWGVRVLQNRLAYLNKLEPHLAGLTLRLHGGALEILESPNPVMALKGKFERSREVDARVGRTHAGPNTLDVMGEVVLDGGAAVPMAAASSGQHKRGLILWLLAHAGLLAGAFARPPVVLIDEFSAHLDATRRVHLLGALLERGSQVWLSDVERPAAPTEGLHLVEL